MTTVKLKFNKDGDIIEARITELAKYKPGYEPVRVESTPNGTNAFFEAFVKSKGLDDAPPTPTL
jgi:hypothetical protein